MNPKERLKNARNKQKELLDKVKAENRFFTEEEQIEFDNMQTEIEQCKALIEAEDRFSQTQDFIDGDDPADPPAPRVHVKPGQEPKIYENLIENLIDCKKAQHGSVTDKMQKVINATGASSGAGEDGGFAIEKQFSSTIMKSAVEMGQILSRVRKMPIGEGYNGATWIDVDETSVAASVYGGVITYWRAEAGTVTATKPKFLERELKLQSLMGLAYMTDELDQDATFLSALFNDAFVTSISRESESAIVSGNGVGKPYGIIPNAGTVEVAKENGQGAATIEWKNIVKMYNRAKKTSSSVWLVHPDVHQQLDLMSFAVGTGGVPIYLPASMTGTVPSMKGLPVIESDQCSALGTAGDIMLVDLNEYLWITKGNIKTDVSIHVKFEYAEKAWRWIVRCNGQPIRNTALTIKNSSNTRSSFVKLATRS